MEDGRWKMGERRAKMKQRQKNADTWGGGATKERGLEAASTWCRREIQEFTGHPSLRPLKRRERRAPERENRGWKMKQRQKNADTWGGGATKERGLQAASTWCRREIQEFTGHPSLRPLKRRERRAPERENRGWKMEERRWNLGGEQAGTASLARIFRSRLEANERRQRRSAGFQPAVSPTSSRQTAGKTQVVWNGRALRVGNPRYSRLKVCATEYAAPDGAADFIGFFTTNMSRLRRSKHDARQRVRLCFC